MQTATATTTTQSRTSARKVARMRADFINKNNMLARRYPQVSPLDYYLTMYGRDVDEEHVLLLLHDKQKYHKLSDIDEILTIAQQRSDAFIFPAAFFKGFVNMSTLQKLYAITIDLDGVSPRDLANLMVHNYTGVRPSRIVNSGHGVHLVYIFTAPIECYNYAKPVIAKMAKILKARLSSLLQDGHADYKTSIMHSYRVVGSLTKLGQIATAFAVDDPWEVTRLARLLHVAWPTKQQVQDKQDKQDKPKKAQMLYLPNAQPGLYGYCLRRMSEVPEGNRYTAMFALSIVAYKCKVDKDALQQSLVTCMEQYNDRGDATIVRMSEVRKALRGYSQKFVRVTAKQLEDYFGWSFDRKTKRNGRTREAHLVIAHAMSAAVRKVDKTQKIRAYLAQNPNATTRQIAADLHMSKSTIAKYR